MNYVGSLSPSTFIGITYWYILVFVNCLIKMRHLVSTATMKVKEATNAYYAHVWKHHSLPEFFLSDWGMQFTSDVWSHLCQMLKIDAKLFTAYHPETDNQTEWTNTVMKHYLQAFCNYMQDDWAKWVLGAEFSANNAPSAITLASPFLANSGQNPHLGFEPSESLLTDITAQSWVKLINVKNFTKRMKELTEHLHNEMLIAQAIYEANANASRHPCPQYFIGDKVWLNAKNLNTAQPVIKLDDCHVSSFWVKHVFERNPLIVELELPEFMKVHPVFHVTLLSHVATDPLPGQRQEPHEPVIAENGEWAWYVNRVLNFKLDRWYSLPLLKYYIDWEGYLSTWEPFNLVDNCQEALDEFHTLNPAAAELHVTPCTISHCQCTDLWLLFKTLSALVLPKFSFSPPSSFFDFCSPWQ